MPRTKYDRIPFSTLFQFVVIKAFELEAEKLRAGDVIDREDVTNERLFRQLHEGRFIDVRTDADGNPIVIGTAEKPARQPAPEPSPDANLEQAVASGDTAPVGGGLEARHEGFGKWFVFAGEVKVSGPHSKDEALKKAGAKPAKKAA
jgi:hypothetical protein